MNKQTPSGVRDFGPEYTKKQETLISKAAKVAESNGYLKVRTPIIEYESALEKGLADHLKSKTIRFIESSGQTLILRPDHTTPIARFVATQMKTDPLPLRLYYQNPIFWRPDEENTDMEIFQSGLELIGPDDSSADAEVIKVLVESLKKLGIKEINIDIGHVDFAKGLSKAKREALLDGDYIRFGSIPDRGDDSIVKDHAELSALGKRLKKEKLDASISYNKGLIKELDYYTGFFFEVFAENGGQMIASGGRYNNLLKTFGYDCPAVGFAINISAIQRLKG